MEVYTYKLNLYFGNYINLVMRRVKSKTDWKNKIQFQLRKINFQEVSLNAYVTFDTKKSCHQIDKKRLKSEKMH